MTRTITRYKQPLPLLASLILLGLHSASASAQTTAKAQAKGPRDYGLAQVRAVNEQISKVWKDENLTPSPPATDGEWCRRVFLDILGRIPAVDEMDAFVKDTDQEKKSKLVSKLLYDEKYTEEFARNWTTLWTNVLIGRNGGNEDRTLTNRAGLQKYLRDSFARGKPYDKMVYELVTATGATKPGMEGYNGAVNFLVNKVNEEKASQATADVSRIFLGLQVQCTQCHNHPFNDWKQQKYWEMNAFFRQTRALRKFADGGRDIESAQLINQDYGGEGGGTPDKAESFYELRNGKLVVAYPVFVDGTEINASGYLEDVNRRDEVGKLIIKSEFLDKAIANRIWAHFLGYGFTKPIDDLGPHNAASHPELLTYLGQEVRKNSYNLKELMRWVALSEAYSLSSRSVAGNAADDPLLGESPKFSHFYLRQMRAEELYESLLVATQAHKTSGSYEEQEKNKGEWLKQFTLAFGTDEGDEATTFNGTIPQALMMFNGELSKKAISLDKGSFLSTIVNGNLKPDAKINYLFLAALGRKPTNNELQVANALLVYRKGNVGEALQDVWWVVLNTNEFILNH